jgi:hypothetical protein
MRFFNKISLISLSSTMFRFYRNLRQQLNKQLTLVRELCIFQITNLECFGLGNRIDVTIFL